MSRFVARNARVTGFTLDAEPHASVGIEADDVLRLPDDPDTLSDPAKVKQALDVDPTTKTWWCQSCGLNYSPGTPCGSCRRHAAIGVLLDGLVCLLRTYQDEDWLDSLDAIATILGDTPNATRGW